MSRSPAPPAVAPGEHERVGGAAAVDPLRTPGGGAGEVRPGAGRPVRVAYCVTGMDASGGVEMNAVRTAESLDRSQVALTVFTMRAEGAMRDRYLAAGVPVVQMPPVSTLVAPRTAAQMWRLSRMFREHRVDVVHCHDNYTNWYAGMAARVASLPLLTSKRWVNASRRHLMLSRLAYRVSNRVLANSDAVGHTLTSVDGVPAARVVVVPNFVEPEAFRDLPGGARDEVLRAWGAPTGGPVIGCVARLREEKGHAVLLRAVAQLRDRWPDVVVVFVGDGPEEASLRALAGTLGIADRVCFAGHRPNRPNPNQIFDIAVLVSDHEGFPNSVVEAMAAGRAVVASNVGGVPDAVQDGETGLLTPPGDHAAVAAALARLLENPAWAARLGEQGRVVARERFRRETVVARLTALYEELVRRSSTSRGRST